MSMFFGYRWLNSYGEADNGIWLAGLHDLKPEQIMRGIEACRVGGKEWPPALPEFRKLCLPALVPPYHVRYRRLEQTTDWDKQLAHLAKVKEILKTHKPQQEKTP